ncbi:pyridoxal-phosphate dependent enzyme [Alcaligenes endophyticus]|uniref:L-serine ammonia-lyase n=1 Tax=Alcaligenes endophyticus TaxID=1929088 RepID=A0ABT8EMY2_9BURK|nr:pyridoxal-phosphate dependent enzyme [Alcaligenes endophyticus]MCX5591460.1 pyridoxal-phosphate dependent enzyme [Alcaligenes endophyticus]MDN4122659.1 pyridoxal-phosphate dependent enzyme [Alcaligenes endophyticus]
MPVLHLTTPLVHSPFFSAQAGAGKQVQLKLESIQPSGSFKIRGIGHACQLFKAQGAQRFISSSGGNAGYAAATAGALLGIPVTVVVPETTGARARRLIQATGATVIVHGASWVDANAYAHTLLQASDRFIHPFDDPLLWEGHASLVDELVSQTRKPDVIVCSVGGGGLLSGIGAGLLRNGWQDVGILAVETAGAASYAAALAQQGPVDIGVITSIATTLGARQVCQQAYDLSHELTIRSHVLSDQDALQACASFLAEHRIAVEPACGAALAALPALRQYYPDAEHIVVVACGGVGIDWEQMRPYM